MSTEMPQSAATPGQTHPPPYSNPGTQVYTYPPPNVTNVVVQPAQQVPQKGAFDVLKDYVPEMPMCLAVTLCVLNTMSPGLGTFISAFCCCCCSTSDAQRGRCERFCTNICVAWLQIFTVWMFLLGWVWSIWWGIIFIAKSGNKHASNSPLPHTVAPQHIPQVSVHPQHSMPSASNQGVPQSGAYDNQDYKQ